MEPKVHRVAESIARSVLAAFYETAESAFGNMNEDKRRQAAVQAAYKTLMKEIKKGE